MADATVDSKAFRSLSYGVYIISAAYEGQMAGCIVNTLHQVTSSPAQVSVAINKENFTTGIVQKAGRFEATILAETARMELIGRFGFHTSAELDKFAETEHLLDPEGTPYVTEHAVAHIGAKVVETVDVGSHYLFIAEVEYAQVLSSETPMTYAYYHLVKGGKTPPKASSYEPAEVVAETVQDGVAQDGAAQEGAAPRYGWRCQLCGYVVEMDELPDDFTCPICGVGKDQFERIELL